ncbi:YeaC family protein [Psychromonas sp.]|uniref:YeaC family protein n=1 Tax=Psychromonas sp. TaxID=1884585 RepID=UPI0035689080
MATLTGYAKSISPALYQQLRQAVETGKWLDGNKLTEEQKAHSLQLLMAYQSQFNAQPEHFTIAQSGEIHMESKKVLKSQFSDSALSDLHKINL